MGRRAAIVLSLLALAALAAGLTLGLRGSGSGGSGAAAQPRAAARHPQHRRVSLSAALRRDARADAWVVKRLLRHQTLVRIGPRWRREIALTFDDGPWPSTRQVLAVLHRLHAPATFFEIGIQLERFPQAVRDELRLGFPIGDHTIHHPPLALLGAAGQLLEIRGQARRLERLGAPAPRLVRPPYGSYNRKTLAIARRLGMVVVMWTVDTRDYARPGVRTIVRTVLAGARPGAIVLMHDGGGDRSQTVAALPTIIRRLRHRGYRLVTVAQLLRPRGMSIARNWTYPR
jgi:peptidoglycan/xylan/chitin deacetylase (PgdA/CDA1 family)